MHWEFVIVWYSIIMRAFSIINGMYVVVQKGIQAHDRGCQVRGEQSPGQGTVTLNP